MFNYLEVGLKKKSKLNKKTIKPEVQAGPQQYWRENPSFVFPSLTVYLSIRIQIAREMGKGPRLFAFAFENGGL